MIIKINSRLNFQNTKVSQNAFRFKSAKFSIAFRNLAIKLMLNLACNDLSPTHLIFSNIPEVVRSDHKRLHVRDDYNVIYISMKLSEKSP
jgi:hypothetical protein